MHSHVKHISDRLKQVHHLPVFRQRAEAERDGERKTGEEKDDSDGGLVSYIYSSAHLKCRFEILVLHLNLFSLCYCNSQFNIILITSLHSSFQIELCVEFSIENLETSSKMNQKKDIYYGFFCKKF